MTSASSQKIHCIVARDAPIAVVYRKGHNKWWHVMKWDLENDVIEHGAWIKAKLYPQYSSISPNGKHICTRLRQGHKEDEPKWNTCFSVSTHPWLQALCAWDTDSYEKPRGGSCFYRNNKIGLSEVNSRWPFHGKFKGTMTRRVNERYQRSKGWRKSKGLTLKYAEEYRSLLGDSIHVSKTILQNDNRHSNTTLIMFYLETQYNRRNNEPRQKIFYMLETSDGVYHELPDVA